VIIAANFAYGWMPTILKSLAGDLTRTTHDLQRARDGELLSPAEIDNLAQSINGSMVGASKVLHFAAPSNYAIWDSRVASYLGAVPQRGHAGLTQYLTYNATCRLLASSSDSRVLTSEVRDVVRQEATTLRALELIMYCAALEKRTYALS
jgi:hypothetical protein